MKKFLSVLLSASLLLIPAGCGKTDDVPVCEQVPQSEYDAGAICPCLMVDGILYFDTGYPSTVSGRCGNMDGRITSSCPVSQAPTKNDQSNFGSGCGYQYGPLEGTVEVQFDDGNWYVFATEEVKAGYKPQTDSSEVIMTAKNADADRAVFLLQNNTADKPYTYGAAYSLEVLRDGIWQVFEPSEPLVWNAAAYPLMPGECAELEVNWAFGYGTLSAGTYRLIKTVVCEENGASFPVYAVFEI